MLRHFCANARFIDSGFKYEKVVDVLGHEVETLRKSYVRDAEIYKELYGRNIVERVFQPRRTKNRPKNGILCASPPVELDAPAGI